MDSTPFDKTRIKKATKSIMTMGGLILLLGILALIYPNGFGKFTTIVIGILIVISGFLRLLFAVTASSVGST